MKIKAIIIGIMACLLLTPAMAQRGREGDGNQHDIATIVGDLSSSQKKKLDAIVEGSKARVGALKAQQKAVRDSIAMYMQREGDQSKVLYPLFEREAQLQCSISREMYATKVRIDEVLTPEQRKKVREAFHSREGQKRQRKSH